MAHPFFDPGRYPWHRQDAQELLRELLEHYDTAKDIKAVYEACGEDLEPVNDDQKPKEVWREVLQELSLKGRLRKLCEMVSAAYPLGFKEIVEKVTHAVDEIRETVLNEKVLVLDRDSFRAQLEDLELDENPTKVLLVRGGPQSGKTHCKHLFHKLAKSVGAESVYLNSSFIATVEDVWGELFTALGGDAERDLPPDPNTTVEAWHGLICQKMRKIAAENNKVLWVAMDDLGLSSDGAPMIESKVKTFFDQFALRMPNPAFSRWFRLLLIHYPDGDVPTKWDNAVWAEDRPDPANVQQPEVEAVLKAWLRKHDRKMEEAKIKEMSAGIITQADAAVPPGQNQGARLRRIHDALVKMFESLKKQPA